MTAHSLSPAELHPTAESRADDVAFTEVAPSAHETLNGGPDMVAGGKVPQTPQPLRSRWALPPIRCVRK